MDLVGVTITKDGKEEDQFVVGCSTHNFWCKGLPPLTHGCRDCWQSYYFWQWAQSGAKTEHVDELEQAIRHAAELADKGQFDFKPEYNVEFSKED